MSIPVKVEVFSGCSLNKPHTVFHYDHFRSVKPVPKGFYCEWVEELQDEFKAYVDFPTSERLIEGFITNKQKVFEKLYLDEEGDILTAIKFTVEEK